MSFGFGGFGSNTNQQPQQGTGFGGFGSTGNTGGFGAPGTTGFGGGSNTNTGGGLFGSTPNTNTSGFGSGGFGSNTQTSLFAAKPAFGAATNTSSGGSLFGSPAATTGSAGFGSFGANTTTSSPFGAASTGGGLFGQPNKPTFGTTPATGSLFGGGQSTGFGGTSTAFGTPASTAFAGNIQNQNQGTGGTPFTAHIEKDGATSQNSHYQSITFMQPYQNFSFEELRLVDYAQGRRYGNQNGQAGAFGTSTGFGGFGTHTTPTSAFGTNPTGGGLFGQTSNQQTSPFGQTTGTGFGATTGSNLFGQNKPATTGLFGSTPTTSGQQTTSLFGTTAGSGFGGGTTGGFGSNTSSGPFGQPQNKPAFSFNTNTGGGFGTNTAGGFGTNTATPTSGSLFGNPTAQPSPFGGTQTGTSNLFGNLGQNQNQQNQPNQSTGSIFGGFGQASQQKPGGLFGTTGTTGSGLFGGQTQQQQQPSTNLFGSSNNQPQTSSLFGAKPVTTGGGLFGGGTNNASTGTGLFGGLGNTQNQQQPASNLFGSFGQQQQKPNLFGPSTTTNTSTGSNLFGGTLGQTSQPSTGLSLFGNANQQNLQQPQSLFNTSQPGMQQSQQPASLTTSINAANPYGNDQLFMSLAAPTQSVGPLATPLSGSQKMKKPALLPQYKINPAASTRLITPQKRTQGYGFSYSNYGSPGSASSTASTPGSFSPNYLSNGNLGRSLGKSFSTSNLSHSFSAEDSILAPGAFSASGTRSFANGAGSLKRLNINRNLRTDLFGNNMASQPSLHKKNVSFDANTAGGDNGSQDAESDGEGSRALVPADRDSATPTPEEQGLLRSSRSSNNGQKNGARPEMEQVNGNELAVVPEDGSPPLPSRSQSSTGPSAADRARQSQKDQTPGEYYMKPSLEELRKMSREQLKKVKGFVVGRQGSGEIEFSEVDLTNVPLDRILGDIVQISTRSATVYQDNDSKPPPGSGLNVPAVIKLENSWPRAKAGRLPVHEKKGPRFQKHVERLQRVDDTEFIDYNPETGVWTFRVQHFTTYGLEYEGEEGDEREDTSMLSAPPESPTPRSKKSQGASHEERSSLSEESSDIQSSPNDTFEFKKGKIPPGSFGDELVYEDNGNTSDQMDDIVDKRQPSLAEHASDSSMNGDNTQLMAPYDGVAEDDDMSDAGQSDSPIRPHPDDSVDQHTHNGTLSENSARARSHLKSNPQQQTGFGTPVRSKPVIGADWTEQLQRTVSPKKRDRQALRESQATVLKSREPYRRSAPKQKLEVKPFATSIDLMNSLWGNDIGRKGMSGEKQGARGKGFEWPYAKRSKTLKENMDNEERAFREAAKPSWGPDGTLVYAIAGDATPLKDGLLVNVKAPIVSEGRDIRFATFVTSVDLSPRTLAKQKDFTEIDILAGVPHAQLAGDYNFADFAELVDKEGGAVGTQEQLAWQLAAILFEDVGSGVCRTDPLGLDDPLTQKIRKAKLSEFWKKLVQPAADQQAFKAATPEEKAIAYLTGHNVPDACAALLDGKDFRLATLIAQIGESKTIRDGMADQIALWRDKNLISEMTEPIRALYELLAGNACVSEGKSNAGPENNASTFKISTRFGLDWRRAFGLRLWYAIDKDQPITEAVTQFMDELRNGREEANPVPWFVEQDVDMGWHSKADKEDREDLLWGLLKIFTLSQLNPKEPVAELELLLNPESVAGNLMNTRLAWQMCQMFSARGIGEFTGGNRDEEKGNEGYEEGTDLADSLTWDYAAQLSASSDPNHWLDAVFVVLHLSKAEQRQKAIQWLLAHHAADLTDEISHVFTTLTQEFHIPKPWIYQALALYARAVLKDRAGEVKYLLHAGEYTEAHTVLCQIVAPRAVIERDYDALRELLGGFVDGDIAEQVQGWNLGGQLYFDFVHLLDLGTARDEEGFEDRRKVLRRLVGALEAVKRGGRVERMGLEERVAVWEMLRVVRRCLLEDLDGGKKGEKVDLPELLKLPLMEDRYLQHTMNLSSQYYRQVVAVGR